MTIVNVSDDIKEKLIQSNFTSRFLNNCFNSKFLSIKVEDQKIVGVGFVGGLLNSYGIEIIEQFRGKGIGKKLLSDVINECKNRNFSFITGVFKPINTISIKIHMNSGFIPLFTFFYNETEGQEIPVLLPLNKKGTFLMKLFQIFDTKIGNIFFGILLSLLRPLLKDLIAFSSDEMPKINLLSSIKNFENVRETLQKNKL